MRLKKVEKFSLYLFSQYEIDSILKIQKILFFLRVYEMKKGIKVSPIFDANNKNFQAWMYGPVNVDSYYFMRPKFYGMGDEGSDDILVKFKSPEFKEYEKSLEIYKPIINRLKKVDAQKLVYYSHHNIEYKNVRGTLKDFEACDKELDENKSDFITFDGEVAEEVNKFFLNNIE